MEKRKIGKKKFMRNLKCYFLILNLVISLIAFSSMVGLVSGASDQEGGGEISDGESDTPDSRSKSKKNKNPKNKNKEDKKDLLGGIGDIFSSSMVQKAGLGAVVGGIAGGLGGGKKGALWGGLAGAAGGAVWALAESYGLGSTTSLLLGIGVAALIFIMTYKKEKKEITEFHCLPWQAPVGGSDCETCNEFEECSEYTCKSLGQACDLVNKGKPEQKCVWVNPNDVTSPRIEFKEVSKDHVFTPDKSVRPPARGIAIKPTSKECIRAFFPLEFTFTTNEPAQCKIDYNLTTNYEDMAFYLNGNSLFEYNHTEKLSLPGPDALNRENPELKNDGEYRLLIRCQDANGNFNQDAYFVSFCVEKGPDTTPPVIVNVNVPTDNPVQFNQSNLNLEVYVNEPTECKWSREDRSYDNMEEAMVCNNRVWQMNNQNVYTCKTTLTGIKDRTGNKYYFRCKDKPLAEEGDRNVNSQSYAYNIIGTQPLNILSIEPNRTIKGATDVIPVLLTIKTDNGFENGEALCYYNDGKNGKPSNDEDYILFSETKANQHVQRQDLVDGNYVYYFKCLDLGGNAVYDSTSFKVETDRLAPRVVRVYKEDNLKIITDEKAECTYSNKDCNFEVESGIDMSSFDDKVHTAEWILNKNFYVRCKDEYGNQPFPNTCSIIARPSQTTERATLDFGF